MVVLLHLAHLQAQPATASHVLELDGQTGYVELPPNVFNTLTQATVEAWVKWDRLGGMARLFNGGQALGDLAVACRGTNLWFVIVDKEANFHQQFVPNLLQVGEWCHIAAVSGPGGMRLYFNGALVASNDYAGSFAATKGGARNRLGKDVSGDPVPPFKGQMAEVRIWRVARTEAEINAALYQQLKGDEPGLVALWNLATVAPGIVKDAGPNGYDGKLVGNARVVPSHWPPVEHLDKPLRFRGRVATGSGEPAGGAYVRLLSRRAEVASARADSSGEFTLVARAVPNEAEGELASIWAGQSARRAGPWPQVGGERKVDLVLHEYRLGGQVLALNRSPLPVVLVEAVWYGANAAPATAPRPKAPKPAGLEPGLRAELFALKAEPEGFGGLFAAPPDAVRRVRRISVVVTTRIRRTSRFDRRSGWSVEVA